MADQLALVKRLVSEVGQLLAETKHAWGCMPRSTEGAKLAERVRAIIAETKRLGFVWAEVVRRSQAAPNGSLLKEDIACSQLLLEAEGLSNNALREQLTWHDKTITVSSRQGWLRDALPRLVAWAEQNSPPPAIATRNRSNRVGGIVSASHSNAPSPNALAVSVPVASSRANTHAAPLAPACADDLPMWIDARLAELDGQDDRPIGGDGKARMPLASTNSSSPAIVTVPLYRPDPLHIVREQAFDAIEQLAPFSVAKRLFRQYRGKVKSLRELRMFLRDCKGVLSARLATGTKITTDDKKAVGSKVEAAGQDGTQNDRQSDIPAVDPVPPIPTLVETPHRPLKAIESTATSANPAPQNTLLPVTVEGTPITNPSVVKNLVPTPAVVLQGEGSPVLVNGIEKRALTKARYAIVSVLVRVFPKRRTKGELEAETGKSDAVSTLRDLRDSDNDWKAALLFPEGIYGAGYGIAPKQ